MVQPEPGGFIPAEYRSAIVVEEEMEFVQWTQGKLCPGEQRVGAAGKSREQFKGVLQYSFACLCCEVNEEAVWDHTALLLHCGIC